MAYLTLVQQKALQEDLSNFRKKFWYIIDRINLNHVGEIADIYLTKRYNEGFLFYNLWQHAWSNDHDDEPNYWSKRKAHNLELVKAEFEKICEKHIKL